MNPLSAETRRLLDAARLGDEPTTEGELAVREGLTAKLGIALTGAAGASAALGAAKTVGAASLSGLASSAHAGGAIGSSSATAISTTALSTSALSAGALTKALAGVLLVAGLGTSAWRQEALDERALGWVAPMAARLEQAVTETWSYLTKDASSEAPPRAVSKTTFDGAWPGSDSQRHERLIAIARRPDHPIAREAELVLILGAEEALAEGDSDRARRFLDEHEAHFAEGALLADREALRAQIDASHSTPSKSRTSNF